jgi:phage shock protein A
METIPMRAKFDQKIRKKQHEIEELEKQIAALQQQIRDANVFISTMEEAKRMLPKNNGEEDTSDDVQASLKEGSALAQARDVLLKAGKPLHVDEILRQMGKEVTKKTRTSLAGSIAGYARDKRVFEKAGANIFKVIGMETKQDPPLNVEYEGEVPEKVRQLYPKQ